MLFSLRSKSVLKRLMSVNPKSKILITRKLPTSCLSLLEQEKNYHLISWNSEDIIPENKLIELIKTNEPEKIHGLIVTLSDKIDKNIINLMENLKVISTYSVGFNHIDVNECEKRGIRVGYTPNVLTKATAELAVSLLLCVARRLPVSAKSVVNGEWGCWKPEWLLGKEVNESTVGIVGLGRIGIAFGEMMYKGFNCKILYSGPNEKKEISWAKYVSFDELLKESDFVVPHCSLNDKTKHLFNESAFKKMKNDGIFINTTRGEVVDQDALYNALKNKDILAAGLDVCSPEPLPTDNKLLELDNCFITPHIGSGTKRTRDAMGTIAAQNLIFGLGGEKMIYEIPL